MNSEVFTMKKWMVELGALLVTQIHVSFIKSIKANIVRTADYMVRLTWQSLRSLLTILSCFGVGVLVATGPIFRFRVELLDVLDV